MYVLTRMDIPESQYGFRKERGTLEMIFTARQPQKKRQEQKCGPLYDLCRPSLTWWALGSWQSLAFSKLHSTGTTASWWHVCKDPKQWKILWIVSSEEWSKAICAYFNHVQNDVFCHAYWWFLWSWRYSNQTSLWWQAIQPKKVASQNQRGMMDQLLYVDCMVKCLNRP